MNLIERIAQLPDPAARLTNLQTAVAGALLRARQEDGASDFPVADAVRLARTSFVACAQDVRTAEATFLVRSGQDALLTNLNHIVFVRLGLTAEQVERQVEFVRHVPCSPATAETALLDEYYELLRATTNWRLNRYEQRPFCQLLQRAGERYRNEYAAVHDELSQWLSSPVVNVGGPTTQGLVDRLRKLRAIVQLGGDSDRRAEAGINDGDDSSSGQMFLLSLSSADPNRFIGGFAREAAGFHLWWSAAWADLCAAYQRMLLAPFGKGDEIDAFFLKFSRDPRIAVAGILGPGPETTAARQWRFVDLTATGTPISLVVDPEGKYGWSSGRVDGRRPAARKARGRVAFWGEVEYDGPQLLEVDNVARQVHLKTEPELTLIYPRCVNCEVSLEATERPLPYAAYEKWLLEDAYAAAQLPLHVVAGRAASRQAFLETDWTAFSLLHLSTHGEAFDATPECSWLRLTGKDRVFFSDILGIDWSGLDLVFLNACMTDQGRKTNGEGSASLAWAFLAGGARAVVATRWPVPDDMAFLFAQCFYSVLCDRAGAPIDDVFDRAMHEFRRTTSPKPHAWGAYVLLT